MTGASDDISWQLVERLARDWAGEGARLAEISMLQGGVVSTTLLLRLYDHRRAVLKLSQHRADPSHALEARQLGLLGSLGVPVPRVYSAGVACLEMPHSHVLMEFVEGCTLDVARSLCGADQYEQLQLDLARIVRIIHGHKADGFGKFDGPTYDAWPAFYRSLVDPVFVEACKLAGLPTRVRKTIRKVHDQLESLLAHDDPPTLNHGDLWSRNVLCDADETGRWRVRAIIDPELRFGHAEAEIAYLDLFKTITPAFKQAYQIQQRLPDAYHTRRKHIYQLYGVLNQYQMRGKDYAPPVVEAADRVSTLLA